MANDDTKPTSDAADPALEQGKRANNANAGERKSHQNDSDDPEKVDEASEDSFPTSDPPAW
jgi:hypothetical protein